MNTVITQLRTRQATAECPVGQEVRIIAVHMELSSQVEGDQIEIDFNRAQDLLMSMGTEEMPLSVGFVDASIGFTNNAARGAIVDPVTGVETYTQNLFVITTPLPDLWWPWAVKVVVASVQGATIVGSIIYQQRSLFVARTGRKR